MSIEIEDFPLAITDDEDHSSRETAMNAAYEVQDEMDALCHEIKQLLAASYAVNIEQAMTDHSKPLFD